MSTFSSMETEAMPPRNWRDEHRLTPRDREVLALVCEGMSGKEIGKALGFSHRAAKVHVRSIKQALGASSRTGIITKSFELGLVDGTQRKQLPASLTIAEREVAGMMLAGLGYADIAALRGITTDGLKNYLIRCLLNKCGCWTRLELASRYVA